MKSQLIQLLETLGYPVFLQGSLSGADYPDSFFTIWDFMGDELTHYDNNPYACTWGFWIYFYSSDPELVASVPLAAKKLLKDNGYSLQGKPTSANSDTITHTGSMLTAYYFENY